MTASALSRPGQRDRLTEKAAEIDWRLAALLCAIAGLGTMMLYSAAGQSWSPWASRHLVVFGVCFAMMLVLSLVDLRVWFIAAYPAYAVALVLLAAVSVVGHSAMGAQRWLHVGPIGVQPSEVMKVGLVLALARFYHGVSAKDARLSWKLLVPCAMIGVPTLLVAHQPDLGTAILLVLTGAAVMFVAGLTWRVLALVALAAVPIVFFGVQFVLKDYQRERVLTFLHPDQDPSGSGYHILQAETALGSGGFLGKGFGLGSQSHLNFLPEKHTDFIFATFAEEFGFLGCFFLLALYAGVVAVSLRIASISHSHFGRLSAAGVTATFALYVLINAAMVMGMAPVVGVPMPLMSYGGTVMVTVMVGFGLVEAVKVHRYAEITSGRGSLL
jgi:rod shape determining protein RodA